MTFGFKKASENFGKIRSPATPASWLLTKNTNGCFFTFAPLQPWSFLVTFFYQEKKVQLDS
jgi:hypothetical protein